MLSKPVSPGYINQLIFFSYKVINLAGISAFPIICNPGIHRDKKNYAVNPDSYREVSPGKYQTIQNYEKNPEDR